MKRTRVIRLFILNQGNMMFKKFIMDIDIMINNQYYLIMRGI